MDILNEYLEEYEFDHNVRVALRKYFHHCRCDGTEICLQCFAATLNAFQ